MHTPSKVGLSLVLATSLISLFGTACAEQKGKKKEDKKEDKAETDAKKEEAKKE